MNIKTFNGTGDKNILVLSGIHGDELTPIFCTSKLINYIENGDFNEIKCHFDHLRIFSAVNMPGIIKNTREVPNQFTPDLNRKFNTHEEFEDKLFELINESDIIIDIHSSPNCTNFVLLNQDESTNSFVDFCLKYNIPYAIQYSAADTIKNYCLKQDKIGITIELNEKNYVDSVAAESGLNIALNFILNDIEIKTSVPKHSTMVELKTHHSGIFIYNKKCGDIIKNGDYIGYVLNLDDFHKTDIYFTMSGDYHMICRDRSDYVSADKIICMLQPIISTSDRLTSKLAESSDIDPSISEIVNKNFKQLLL